MGFWSFAAGLMRRRQVPNLGWTLARNDGRFLSFGEAALRGDPVRVEYLPERRCDPPRVVEGIAHHLDYHWLHVSLDGNEGGLKEAIPRRWITDVVVTTGV